MAKQSTVSYKLGIDTMRGKLATKQQNIIYSGQVVGENTLSIGLGKHEATNFDKYIVLTQRRGKNFFYCKSRTAIRNSVATTFRRASIAIASALADYVIPYVKTELSYKPLREAFEYDGGGKTLREYIVAACLRSFEMNEEYVYVLSAPLDESGVRSVVNIIVNPLYSLTVAASSVKAYALDPSTPFFTELVTRAALVQEYMRYFAGVMRGVQAPITVIDTRTGRKYETMLVATALDQPMETIGRDSVQANVFGMRFGGTEEVPTLETITIYDRKRYMAVQGKPYLDETKTQEVEVATTSFQAAKTLYI